MPSLKSSDYIAFAAFAISLVALYQTHEANSPKIVVTSVVTFFHNMQQDHRRVANPNNHAIQRIEYRWQNDNPTTSHTKY